MCALNILSKYDNPTTADMKIEDKMMAWIFKLSNFIETRVHYLFIYSWSFCDI